MGLWKYRSSIGLVGNHINVETGQWVATDSGIGASVDSYFEYLVKGSALLSKPELMDTFFYHVETINKYMRKDDWYFLGDHGQRHNYFTSLSESGSLLARSTELYWPKFRRIEDNPQLLPRLKARGFRPRNV